MRAVFRHELSGYFTTPVGYVFLTMYALLSGLVFVFINIGQEMSASMNLLFSGMQLPLMLIAPLLTMRLFAEEKRMRTDQLLLTSPVPLGQIVLGKALASLALLMIAMLLALIYPLLISPYAQIAWSEIAVVFLGYYLLDAAMVSVGVLLSSLCTNQITAAILTLGVNVLMYLSEHYIVPQAGTSAYLHPVSVILSFLPSSSRLGVFRRVYRADVLPDRPRDGKAPPRKGVIFDEEEIHTLWGLSPADVRAGGCDGGAGRAGQPARGGKVVLETRRIAERGNKLKRLHALPPA